LCLMKGSILIVDENDSSRENLQKVLNAAGFHCWLASNVGDARLQLEERLPAMVLLDWYQSSISIIDFIGYLRHKVAMLSIPVIVLSDRKNSVEKIAALEAGADDFIDKPFSPDELTARIQALLRRVDGRLSGDVIEVAGLRLELLNYAIFAGPSFTKLKIGRMAFQLLVFLVVNPERVFSRDDILNNIWGESSGINKRTVDVHIRHLRRDLTTTGHDKHLQTVRGCGYRFSLKV
ncbi:MAG: winged helix-turn-helix domain-containing protein, partial [Magnetococcales bacterium]|nr:winged helix-turn-helix domain-containing protein [Magnetococcales bacterium]